MADPTANVKAWNEAFWRAWNAAEVETVAHLVSEDVEIVWAYKEEQASGREALLKLLQWEFSFPSTQVTVKQISEKIYQMGDGSWLVQDHSMQTYPSPDGNPVTELVRATAPDAFISSIGAWPYAITAIALRSGQVQIYS